MSGESPIPETLPLPRPFGSKYVLLRHLATGGMADVFLARQSGHAGFVKECVIKRILPQLARDPQFVTMFLDEARLCARLSHPHIAQVYDLGRVGDSYFIAMEYVDGVDLEQLLDVVQMRGETLVPASIAARIVAAVAEGLEHAHRAVDRYGRPLGIVHRDVTPSNIMVSFDGVAKVLDFGIAKAESKQSKTETGVVRGKAPYMSPEQVMGEPVDARSDLFSLGAILYELTTGCKPFDGESMHAIGTRVIQDEPVPPSVLVADYPEGLEGIVMAALAKRPAERIASARMLQDELERFLVGLGLPATTHDVAEYLGARLQRAPAPGDGELEPGSITPPEGVAELGIAADSDVGERPSSSPGAMASARAAGGSRASSSPPPAVRSSSSAGTLARPLGGLGSEGRFAMPASVTIEARPAIRGATGGAQPIRSDDPFADEMARFRAAAAGDPAQRSGPSAPRPSSLLPLTADVTPAGAAMDPGQKRPPDPQQITLGDGSFVDETRYDQPPRHSLGGGARWMAVVIVGLVIATGVVLLLLHRYELRREARGSATTVGGGAPAEPAGPPPAVPPPNGPAAATPDRAQPAIAPAAAPAAGSGPAPSTAAPSSAAVHAEPVRPKVTPLGPPARPAVKPKRGSTPHPHEGAPAVHSLPRLPDPPPAD